MRARVRATPSVKPGVYRVLGDTVNGDTCRSETRTGKDEMIGECAIEPVQWNPFQLRTSDVCREKNPAWARSNSGICARLGGSDRALATHVTSELSRWFRRRWVFGSSAGSVN